MISHRSTLVCFPLAFSSRDHTQDLFQLCTFEVYFVIIQKKNNLELKMKSFAVEFGKQFICFFKTIIILNTEHPIHRWLKSFQNPNFNKIAQFVFLMVIAIISSGLFSLNPMLNSHFCIKSNISNFTCQQNVGQNFSKNQVCQYAWTPLFISAARRTFINLT